MTKTTQIRAHFRPQSINEKNRTVDLCFATEAKVLRQNEDGSQFYEVLAMNPRHANLERLNSGGALLDNHNRSSVDSQIGVIDRAWIDAKAKQAFVTARFSSSPERQRLWDDVKSGIIQNVSFGYTVERFVPLAEYKAMCRSEEDTIEPKKEDDEDERAADDDEDEDEEDTEDKSRSIPTLVGIGWQALEVSLVTIPADIDAGTRSETQKPTLTRTTQLRSQMNEELKTDNGIDAATQKAMSRLLEIKDIVRTAGLPEAVETRYMISSLALDEIRKDAFREMAARSNQTETRAHISAGALDESQTRREGMENAILHRANPTKFKIDERGKPFAKLSLLGLARRSLDSAGMRSDHYSDDEVVTRSLQGTSEFPVLLTNVMNKSLRADYEGAPSIWRNFTRVVPVKDFRPVYKMQLGDIPMPTKVNEKGEARRVSLSEAQTSYRIYSYAQIINFTREIMINDDLNFIAQIPGKMGLACAELEANIVLGLITSNPVMADGIPLFDPRHNNILEGGHIIDIDSTSTVRAMMRKHVGLDGRKLNITPANYLVPTALETISEQFISTNLMADATNKINPFAGRLGVLCDVRLDDSSPYDWYMLSAPTSSVDVIEAAYLNGAEGPRFESRMGFETSGMELKCSMDFGAGLIDHRGIFKVIGKQPNKFDGTRVDPSTISSRPKSVLKKSEETVV